MPSFKDSKVGNAEPDAGTPCGVAQGGSAVQERRRRSRKGDRRAQACKEDGEAEGAQDASMDAKPERATDQTRKWMTEKVEVLLKGRSGEVAPWSEARTSATAMALASSETSRSLRRSGRRRWRRRCGDFSSPEAPGAPQTPELTPRGR